MRTWHNGGMTKPVPLRWAARELGVPARWLREEAEQGRVPCLRAGGSYLFDVRRVAALLLERARQDGGNAAGPDEGRGGGQ